VKPLHVVAVIEKVGVAKTFCDVPDTVPDADSKPLRVVVIVTVDDALFPRPDCVIPLPDNDTEPAVVDAE